MITTAEQTLALLEIPNTVFSRRIFQWAIRAADAVSPFLHAHDYRTLNFKLEFTLTPARKNALHECSADILAPASSHDPGAMPGWWPQTRRLAHDFPAGKYAKIT